MHRAPGWSFLRSSGQWMKMSVKPWKSWLYCASRRWRGLGLCEARLGSKRPGSGGIIFAPHQKVHIAKTVRSIICAPHYKTVNHPAPSGHCKALTGARQNHHLYCRSQRSPIDMSLGTWLAVLWQNTTIQRAPHGPPCQYQKCQYQKW